MKKLLLLLALFIGFGVYAQPLLITVTGDTATNGETITTVFPKLTVNKKYAVQTVYEEISGDATVQILLQGSVDGTNYKDITTDTLALTADGNNIWTGETGLPYRYLRVECVQTGTATGNIVSYLYMKEDKPEYKGHFETQYITASSDTITNAGSDQADFEVALAHDWDYAVQVVFDEITNGATATINLQGSIDGTNYDAIGDTYTATADGNYIWTDVAGTTYKYLRINCTQTGTTTTRIYGYLVLKPNYQ